MTITKEEVAEAVRTLCIAHNTRDIPTIVAMEAQAVGFGFRDLAWRDHAVQGEEARAQLFERFFDRMDYHRLELEDLHTSVAGDIGLAWGVYIEEFQETGRPPERARVRFSNVFIKGTQGWQILQYHRDIQPFTEEGRYPKALTVASPDN